MNIKIKNGLWIALSALASALCCLIWLLVMPVFHAFGSTILSFAVIYLPWGIVAYYWEKLRRLEDTANSRIKFRS